jgi:Ca-activated chloride channel homolog
LSKNWASRISFTLLGAFCAMIHAVAVSPVAAQQASSTILVVLDASGSMWGELPGGTGNKFETAQAALEKHLPAPRLRVKTGLVTFGPGCSRIDVGSPPAIRPVAQTLAPLNEISPRSKGPISAALEQSLSLLDAGKKSTMVLLVDGPDNCRQDPCAVAARLAAERPLLRIHTVGLGLARPGRSIACISRATKGRFFPAVTGPEAEAAVAKAVKLAMHGVRNPRLKREPGIAKRPQRRFDPNGPSQLVLDASLGKADTAVDKPVRWRVYKGETAPGAAVLPVLDVLEPRFSVPLAAGAYWVDASLGRAKYTSKVDITEKGPTFVKAVFKAGLVKLSADGPALPIPVVFTVNKAGADGAAPLVVSPYRQSELVLPVGSYDIRAEAGALSVKKTVKVSAGDRQEISFALPVSELRLSASAQDGGVSAAAYEFTVLVDDPDKPGGRRVVARSTAPTPVFRLPAGTYYTEVKSGLAVASGRVALGAGSSISRSLNLDLARIKVEAQFPTSADSQTRPVVYKLFSRDPLSIVARSSWRSPQFVVPPGRYRILAEIGARNVRTVQDLDLSSGDDRSVLLNVMAGDVKLRVSDGQGRAITGQFWEVLDSSGALVWRTQQGSPRGLLAPGRYSVRCETRKGTVEGAFVVAAGDAKTIELRVR